MKTAISILVILLAPAVFAQNNGKLIIEFTSTQKPVGLVLYELANEKGERIRSGVSAFNSPKVTIELKDLPKGKYTIKAFHDLNSDEKLNTGTFGIPKEPYGFSNNARGWMGPPSVEDQLFEVNSVGTRQVIQLK